MRSFHTVSPGRWVNRVRSRAGAWWTPAAALAYDPAVFPARRPLNLPVERVRSRVGAYIYGNILVLAAILATSPENIAHWTAVIFVVATTATTFLAHVVAHRIGQAIGRTDDEALRLHLAQEARDAVPIMTSGTAPAVLLALASVGWLPPELAQLLAEAVVVLRLAGMGIIVRRISGYSSPRAGRWSGFALAGISVVIAALKDILTH
jgi:hypothetical protein